MHLAAEGPWTSPVNGLKRLGSWQACGAEQAEQAAERRAGRRVGRKNSRNDRSPAIFPTFCDSPRSLTLCYIFEEP